MTSGLTEAMFAYICPQEDIPILYELMGLDVIHPITCPLYRLNGAKLTQQVEVAPLHWSRQTEYPWAARVLRPRSTDIILDVGGGYSPFRLYLARRCKSVINIDINEVGMEQAKTIATDLGFENLHDTVMDVRDLTFPDNYFDSVSCVSTLEHICEGRDKALSEMLRVLKPGGTLALTMDIVTSRDDPAKPIDNFYIEKEDIPLILQPLAPVTFFNHGGALSTHMDKEGVDLVVLMVKHVKGM